MMPRTQLQEIRDPELRALMERATQLLDEDQYIACVRVCAEAYLRLLKTRPHVLQALKTVLQNERVKAGLETGTLRFAPVMWPRLAAKLQLSEGGEPTIVFDRQFVGFGEAIQYYEFTLDLICQAEKGEVKTTMGAGGL
jgi:hypothetical protein